MPRTVLALTALLCSLSPALASLSPRTVPPPADDKLTTPLASALPQDRPLPPDLLRTAYPRERDDEYRVTSQTEVFLDGRPCVYADVPKNAGIVRMEVSSDGQTVLKILFRSKK
jgi:hypothetical protein